MKKKIWLGVLWGLSCGAQEQEPDFFNERTTVVGIEESVVLHPSPSLGMGAPKAFNEKREEKGILVDGEKQISVPPPVVQPIPNYARSAWGGKETFANPQAIGWSIPATFATPQRMRTRSGPPPMASSGYVWR
jgi:hypothetical protein